MLAVLLVLGRLVFAVLVRLFRLVRAVRVRIATGAGRPCATVRVTAAPALAARMGIADRAPRTVCPRGGALPVEVPGPSLAVVTLPARAG